MIRFVPVQAVFPGCANRAVDLRGFGRAATTGLIRFVPSQAVFPRPADLGSEVWRFGRAPLGVGRDVMSRIPNHPLERTRHQRRGCKTERASAGSLSCSVGRGNHRLPHEIGVSVPGSAE